MFKQCNSSKDRKSTFASQVFALINFTAKCLLAFVLTQLNASSQSFYFISNIKALGSPRKRDYGFLKQLSVSNIYFSFFFFFSFYKAFYNKLNTKVVINKKEVCIKKQNFYWLSCNDQHKKLKQKNRVIYIEQLKIYSYCMKFLRFVTDL